jgi:hypothetical protein
MAIFVECRSHHFLPAAIWADMLLPEYLCCFSLWREVPQGKKWLAQNDWEDDGLAVSCVDMAGRDILQFMAGACDLARDVTKHIQSRVNTSRHLELPGAARTRVIFGRQEGIQKANYSGIEHPSREISSRNSVTRVECGWRHSAQIKGTEGCIVLFLFNCSENWASPSLMV